MTREQIVERLRFAGFGGHPIENMLYVIERAGLTIIPKEPDADEIERVGEAILRAVAGIAITVATLEREARAAAAAVRANT